MDRTGFYVGIGLIVIGTLAWLVRPNIGGSGGRFQLPGLHITVDTPAFVLIVLGISLMWLSQKFNPDPDPVPATVYRVCTGQNEGNCGYHTHFYTCGYFGSDEQIGKNICKNRPANATRVKTWGGNKCGYSLIDVTCG